MTTQRLGSTDIHQQLLAFGSALKKACERAGVSKRQLAAAASLDRAAITRIEQGKRAPKFDKLLLLAHAANTTPAALLANLGPQDATAELDAALASHHNGARLSQIDPVRRFAENLKWVRQHVESGITQEGLALEAEIDRSSPNGYETGRMAPPTLRTILKLATGLGVSPVLLLTGVVLTDAD